MTKLREIRVAAGLAQSEVARRAGMYCSTVSRLEMAREKAGPSLRARVSEALRRSEQELFDEAGWPLLAEEAHNEDASAVVSVTHSSPVPCDEDDHSIIASMRSGYVDDAHAAARELGRRFTRLADLLEDLGELKSDDAGELEAEFLLLAKAGEITKPYETFSRAVDAVRQLSTD